MTITKEGLAHLQSELLKARTEAIHERRKHEEQRQLVERLTDEADSQVAFALAVDAITKHMDRGSVDSLYAYADGYCDALGLDRDEVMRAVKGVR